VIEISQKPFKELGIKAVVKPTRQCNLKCKYCYVGDNTENTKMDFQTLENTIVKLIEHNSSEKATSFAWHGGEPLLMGLDFFIKITDLQKQYKQSHTILNSIQTNGTFLNQDILDFCADTGFYISISLDGPSELHNTSRIFSETKGSFDLVMKAIYEMKSRSDVNGGVIATITRPTLERITDFYAFFKEVGLDLKVSPLIHSGRAIENLGQFSISPEEYGKFMISLFDIWFNENKPTFAITNFRTLMRKILERVKVKEEIPYSPCIDSFVGIGPNGDVYPCGRYDNISEFKIGNINEDTIKKILSSPNRLKFYSKESECNNCQDYNVCIRCEHNAYMVNSPVDYYCGGYQKLINHVAQRVRKELEIEAH